MTRGTGISGPDSGHGPVPPRVERLSGVDRIRVRMDVHLLVTGPYKIVRIAPSKVLAVETVLKGAATVPQIL